MDKEKIKNNIESWLNYFLKDVEALKEGKLGNVTQEKLISHYSSEIWSSVEEELPHWFHFSTFYMSTGGCPSIVCGDRDYFIETGNNMRLSIKELQDLPKK